MLEPERELGMDELYAEVALLRCAGCGTPWLRYHYENESVSRSGRWFLGALSEELAARATAADARATLASLDRYHYGGSYFGGRTGTSSGPIPVP